MYWAQTFERYCLCDWMDEWMDVYLTDVQQVVKLQLLVDCEPVSLHLFLFLLGYVIVFSFYGTVFLHIIPAQTFAHLNKKRERKYKKKVKKGC